MESTTTANRYKELPKIVQASVSKTAHDELNLLLKKIETEPAARQIQELRAAYFNSMTKGASTLYFEIERMNKAQHTVVTGYTDEIQKLNNVIQGSAHKNAT